MTGAGDTFTDKTCSTPPQQTAEQTDGCVSVGDPEAVVGVTLRHRLCVESRDDPCSSIDGDGDDSEDQHDQDSADLTMDRSQPVSRAVFISSA